MIAICINRSHYTPKGIQETRSFSINIRGRSMLEVLLLGATQRSRSSSTSKTLY
ncbi:MAG: hypothetical protein ABSH41_24440 [Syntrophobacteraceae bacterium]